MLDPSLQIAVIVNELITDHNLDVICLTETWLKPDEFTVLNEASPPGYTRPKLVYTDKFVPGLDLICRKDISLSL